LTRESLPPISIGSDSALIIADVQNDFCPGGALGIPGGDEIIPILNKCIERFQAASRPICVTRDWHPANHCSFKEQGGPWSPHCVQGTPGAAFHPDFKFPSTAHIISKATSAEKEAYSAFEGTSLKALLRDQGIKHIFVGGLATDYCVKQTVLDGLDAGFEVFLLEDAVRGVNANPGDSEKAKEEMIRKGARAIFSDQVSQ